MSEYFSIIIRQKKTKQNSPNSTTDPDLTKELMITQEGQLGLLGM